MPHAKGYQELGKENHCPKSTGFCPRRRTSCLKNGETGRHTLLHVYLPVPQYEKDSSADLLRNWAQMAMFLLLRNGAAPWALSE
jgi:hypothetical protein